MLKWETHVQGTVYARSGLIIVGSVIKVIGDGECWRWDAYAGGMIRQKAGGWVASKAQAKRSVRRVWGEFLDLAALAPKGS